MWAVMRNLQIFTGAPGRPSGIGAYLRTLWQQCRGAAWSGLAIAVLCLARFGVHVFLPAMPVYAQAQAASTPKPVLPPRLAQVRRFLARRGWTPGSPIVRAPRRLAVGGATASGGSLAPQASPPPGTWQPVGPNSVLTSTYGAVTGRVSALALDPSDATGNLLYVGTTGGGVWAASNAAVSDASQVVFTPLTDAVGALGAATDASIGIGALTVQPGGTGVILAGTGDPNDALDSYYGAGILRSADGGTSWSLIPGTADLLYSFTGEGFAGFAWSTVNPQLVVAAVSQAYEGTLVNALAKGRSYEGLYYSTDSGATWSLATITDGAGEVVQQAGGIFAAPDGNAATAVVWNPVRQMFIAAVRFHGYYQSTDGVTFTRMAAQPGTGLSGQMCPANSGQIGSIDCPLFRGALAVNPETGDTFAWTVDIANQDQGIWQDPCAIKNSGACGNATAAFSRQWQTQALETDTPEGPATIASGDYNLTLAAVPYALQQGADTWLLAGATDLWRCSLAMGCVWRNTTNAFTCMSAKVAPFQHALAWSAKNPLEILLGNDSGLWRSLDAIGESGQACAADDSSHFQNLNGGLGSLAEVESLGWNGVSQFNMMAGLGVNGTAGLKSATTASAQWPQILGGDGGVVAIDPQNAANWYVNTQAGVSIYLCSNAAACSPADFGSSPVVTDADVGGDGDTMTSPAPFLVDPLDATQLLVGTCRVWRGPANGVGWKAADAASPILDSPAAPGPCSGNALIRYMAALPTSGHTEAVYVGLYGHLNGGASIPGHVLGATIDSGSGATPVWHDLTLNPVTNSPNALNKFGADISSIFIDPHDPSGKTVYVTVEGFANTTEEIQAVYGSTDGGAHWASQVSNLPSVPVSAALVDPQSANTVYLATDAGVYFTTQIAACSTLPSTCWTVFGTGLPGSPVVQLSASRAAAQPQLLTAATYGRGIWQAPLWTAGNGLTTAVANPDSLIFASQVFGTASSPQTVTLTNTGSLPLTPTAIQASGDFSETDTCVKATIAAGANCNLQVTFTPTATGNRSGQLTIDANVSGGQVTVALSGVGAPAGAVSLTPASIDFGPVPVGTTSAALQVEAANSSNAPVPITSISVTAPFAIASNACGTTALAAQADCQITVGFKPVQPGAATGTLTLVDGAGTQTVQLKGNGASPPTDQLNPTSLSFPNTAVDGQASAPLQVLLTNTGNLPLKCIVIWAGAASTTASNCLAIPSIGQFAATNTCNGQLAGPGSCSASVVFAPTSLGAQTGTLWVYDALRTQQVALSGTGVQNATLAASPASLTFAQVELGSTSPPLTLTITNTGGVDAANVGFQITGEDAASFATGNNPCTPGLKAGASCAVQVTFKPSTAGGSAASLVITSSTRGVKPVTVPLNGSANAPSGLNVAPPNLTFAPTLVGATSAAQTVTVSNASSVAASQLSIAASAGFALTQNTCASSLASKSTCTVGVEFAPTATGPATGTVTVASATISTSATVILSGTGAVAAGIAVTPANIAFPITGAGQTSNPITATVTNTGTADPLTGLALAVPAGFQLVSNTCTDTLGPGLSCTAGVEFAPAAAGAQSGNLTVTSATVASGVAVPLTGMGFDFTVAVSGSSTQSVAGGQSASYTLVLTPLNGSSGAFGFACGTMPSYALCTFSPAAETLNGGTTGNVAVLISTGRSTATSSLGGLGGWDVLPLACAVLLLPLGRRSRRGLFHGAILLAALAILAGGVASCTSSGGGKGGGGGGSGGSGGSTTPAGTYSIVVKVTSTGVEHDTTLTLTVE